MVLWLLIAIIVVLVVTNLISLKATKELENLIVELESERLVSHSQQTSPQTYRSGPHLHERGSDGTD